MLDSNLHRMLMMIGGVILTLFMLFYLFGGPNDAPDENGYVDDFSGDIVEQSEARTHKY